MFQSVRGVVLDRFFGPEGAQISERFGRIGPARIPQKARKGPARISARIPQGPARNLQNLARAKPGPTRTLQGPRGPQQGSTSTEGTPRNTSSARPDLCKALLAQHKPCWGEGVASASGFGMVDTPAKHASQNGPGPARKYIFAC